VVEGTDGESLSLTTPIGRFEIDRETGHLERACGRTRERQRPWRLEPVAPEWSETRWHAELRAIQKAAVIPAPVNETLLLWRHGLVFGRPFTSTPSGMAAFARIWVTTAIDDEVMLRELAQLRDAIRAKIEEIHASEVNRDSRGSPVQSRDAIAVEAKAHAVETLMKKLDAPLDDTFAASDVRAAYGEEELATLRRSVGFAARALCQQLVDLALAE
jgi:hypothetical protein